MKRNGQNEPPISSYLKAGFLKDGEFGLIEGFSKLRFENVEVRYGEIRIFISISILRISSCALSTTLSL
jgi:hypothetical protein